MKIHDTMKSVKFSMIAALGLTILAACNRESVPEDAGGLPMWPAPFLKGETKASLTTDSLEDFCLQVVSEDYHFSYFESVSKKEGAWAASRQLYWKNQTSPVTYKAVAYGLHDFTPEDFQNGVDLVLSNNQRSQDRINDADLLTVPVSTIKYSDTSAGELPLAFSHALSKVGFTISLGERFYQNGYGVDTNPISCVFVKGTNLGFHFDPASGEVTVKDGTAEDIKPFPSAFTPGTAADMTSKALYEVILVPQTIPAGALAVTFSVCEMDFTWSNPEEITLSPGQTCNLAISVKEAPSPSNHINGHQYVEMGDGLKWATCNIGATHPYMQGEVFYWGAVDQYKYTRWRNGNYTDPDAVLAAMTGSGYSANDVLRPEDDPATSNWGAPWRIPTAEEWEKLCDKNNFTWSSVNVMYMVTSKVPGYEGNCIYIPYINKSTGFIGTASGFYFMTASLNSQGNPITGNNRGVDNTFAYAGKLEIMARPVAN